MLAAVQVKFASTVSCILVWIGILLGFSPPDRRVRRLPSVPWYAPDYVYRNHWEAGATSLMEPVEKVPLIWSECAVEGLPRRLWPIAVLGLGMWLAVS
ncbi:membrane-associated protein, putative [Bodo saltans]|uniref:Membrane-associated protein, putative n=1 Tax=Bodo saltans TaxID=75058 RepID=A0A0S4KP03_BODSA|nr:membrane-associated protein, putative [Bodo saltans]|eukprot:CUI15348.1 membrane-associated protein, putative [Bodo saltans]